MHRVEQVTSHSQHFTQGTRNSMHSHAVFAEVVSYKEDGAHIFVSLQQDTVRKHTATANTAGTIGQADHALIAVSTPMGAIFRGSASAGQTRRMQRRNPWRGMARRRTSASAWGPAASGPRAGPPPAAAGQLPRPCCSRRQGQQAPLPLQRASGVMQARRPPWHCPHPGASGTAPPVLNRGGARSVRTCLLQ